MSAIHAYRNVLRSARIAFNGDQRVLSAARKEARAKFNAHRNLSSHDAECEQKLIEAQEVARMLRQNIVQGKSVAGQEGRYELRIHEETERGDNATIRNTSELKSGCCGGH